MKKIAHFRSKLMHNLQCGESSQNFWATFVIKKLPQSEQSATLLFTLRAHIKNEIELFKCLN
jgi:hypothetical protein